MCSLAFKRLYGSFPEPFGFMAPCYTLDMPDHAEHLGTPHTIPSGPIDNILSKQISTPEDEAILTTALFRDPATRVRSTVQVRRLEVSVGGQTQISAAYIKDRKLLVISDHQS